MSIRARFALVVAVVASVGIGAVSAAAYVSARAEQYAEVDRFLAERAEFLHSPGGRPRGGPGLARRLDLLVVQVLDEDGRTELAVGDDVDLPVDEASAAVAGGDAGRALATVAAGGERYRVLATALPGGGAIRVARDLDGVEEVLGGLRRRLVLVGLLGTALAAGTGWLAAGAVTRPLRALTSAAGRVAATGDLRAFDPAGGAGPGTGRPGPALVGRDDEVGRLAGSFAAMLDALGAAREEQRRLVDDASHELRTPLTSLRTNIDVLALGATLDPADHGRLLADLQSELGELEALTTELVELARSSGADAEPAADLALDELVARAAERARRRLGRPVEVEVHPATVCARPAGLARAVDNLVANAEKFSPAGTPVHLEQRAGRVVVRDHGTGIHPADRAHVFDRFYRSDRARSTPGSGLGLAIVADIVRAAGGTCIVEAAADGGAVVGFELPVVEH